MYRTKVVEYDYCYLLSHFHRVLSSFTTLAPHTELYSNLPRHLLMTSIYLVLSNKIFSPTCTMTLTRWSGQMLSEKQLMRSGQMLSKKQLIWCGNLNLVYPVKFRKSRENNFIFVLRSLLRGLLYIVLFLVFLLSSAELIPLSWWLFRQFFAFYCTTISSSSYFPVFFLFSLENALFLSSLLACTGAKVSSVSCDCRLHDIRSTSSQQLRLTSLVLRIAKL